VEGVEEIILRRLEVWPLCSWSMITSTIPKVPKSMIEQALDGLVKAGKVNRQIRKTGGNRLAEAFYLPGFRDKLFSEILDSLEVR
jgi:hypothetical protein